MTMSWSRYVVKPSGKGGHNIHITSLLDHTFSIVDGQLRFCVTCVSRIIEENINRMRLS